MQVRAAGTYHTVDKNAAGDDPQKTEGSRSERRSRTSYRVQNIQSLDKSAGTHQRRAQQASSGNGETTNRRRPQAIEEYRRGR